MRYRYMDWDSKIRKITKLAFIFFIIVNLLFSKYISSYNTRWWVSKQNYDGIITQKYIDKKRRNAGYIAIDSNDRFNVVRDLYDIVRIGDSIVKRKGTVRHLIFREDSLFDFYPYNKWYTIYDDTLIKR